MMRKDSAGLNDPVKGGGHPGQGGGASRPKGFVLRCGGVFESGGCFA